MPETSEFAIRTMRRPELDIAIEWASHEGWNPGLCDSDSFHHADPSGFFMGFTSGVPVACISSVAYDGTFGFLGLYIVRPEYRGRGFGIRIWEKALEYLDGRNTGLDGVVARQADYEKYGFKLAYRNLRFVGSPATLRKSSGHVVDLKDFEILHVVNYDSQMFPARRDSFVSKWICQSGSKALGYKSNGKLAGYGVMRPCFTGFKIGPLFADNREIAEELLSELARHAGANSVFIDIPEPNQQALDLVKKSGMKKIFETARMYSNATPRLPLERIYGITTLELG